MTRSLLHATTGACIHVGGRREMEGGVGMLCFMQRHFVPAFVLM